MQKFLLIAAGGIGSRLGSGQPKQFIELAGKPLLVHVIETFQKYDPNINIVITLNRSLHTKWFEICRDHGIYSSHVVTDGGPTRYHSVKTGLTHIPENSLVAVHDAARPLVSLSLIARTFEIAGKFGNAIPVIHPNDSIRFINNGNSSPIPREHVRLVQTPQCFKAIIIKNAYKSTYNSSYTDDATVIEASGERLFLTDGCINNIKITNQADLKIAEALL